MKQPKVSKIAKAIVSTLAGSIFMLQPATASLPDTHIFNNADEISDEELSGMRGRYVGTGEILYFGVEMYTQWQTQDGRTLNSGMNLAVDSHFRPTVTIVTQTTAATSQNTAGQNSVSINGGLANVSGVAQSIQIGGDGNTIRNDFTMNIDRHATNSSAASTAASGTPLNGAGSATIDSDNTTTTVTLSGNSLSMNVNIPGQGQVLQQLKGGQGFLQSAKIGGDLNSIHNIININAGMRSATGVSSAGMQSALNSLRGIRMSGSY